MTDVEIGLKLWEIFGNKKYDSLKYFYHTLMKRKDKDNERTTGEHAGKIKKGGKIKKWSHLHF